MTAEVGDEGTAGGEDNFERMAESQYMGMCVGERVAVCALFLCM